MKAIALLLLLCCRLAAADEVTHLRNGGTCDTGKTVLLLPPGYLVPDSIWNDMDSRIRVMQDDVTRLNAENDSLRASAGAVSTSVLYLVGAFAAGMVAARLAL